MNVRHKEGCLVLREAACRGHDKCLEALIKAGASVTVQGKYDNTALMGAARHGHDICAQILIAAGANVNSQNKYGHTALIMSAQFGHNKCVETLIRAGAHMDTKHYYYGETALIMSVRFGHDKCVHILTQAGADVNIKDQYGYSALMRAAALGHDKCVETLILAGANLNKQNNDYCAYHPFLNKEEYEKLLFAAGGKEEAANKFVSPESKLHLSHLCRDVIRKHLLHMRNMNLFARIPKLGLPKPLQKFLLFTEILDD